MKYLKNKQKQKTKKKTALLETETGLLNVLYSNLMMQGRLFTILPFWSILSRNYCLQYQFLMVTLKYKAW